MPTMIVFVLLLVGAKDLAVASGWIPDTRHSLAIFCLSMLASYGLHQAVRLGLFPWFAKDDKA